MEWVYMILHPFMTLAQLGDSPRVPSVQQYDTFVEPDVHQQPVSTAAPDEADVDVHQQYIFLTTKPEDLTEGTEAYIVAEECLSIARSYNGQPTVSHRSRRLQRMDDH
ncbi:hypothetical protein GmHk_06G016667 [Glycine max]|nr:hypothetical protein GmHk_06G016667 [Glycine max]KAH1246626.1 hypothetical protein GmHk_06G016667 [Glycine max]